MPAKDDPVVIKKYANRRLYNTGTSTYVTLEDLAEMVKNGDEFIVQDAKTGEDITHPVLTQIIFEQENKDGSEHAADRLPAPADLVLRRPDAMVIPSYLEQSMCRLCARSRTSIRDQMKSSFGKIADGSAQDPTPHQGFEEQARAQHRDVPECDAACSSPFAGANGRRAATRRDDRAQGRNRQRSQALKSQIAEMQRKST